MSPPVFPSPKTVCVAFAKSGQRVQLAAWRLSEASVGTVD
jgi:hypothetical protein